MTDVNIRQALAEASDDTAQPLEASIGQVVRRGRRRVLLRNSGGIAASILTVGGVVLGAAQFAGGRSAGLDQPPAAGNGQTDAPRIQETARPARTAVAAPPSVTRLSDGEIIRRCKVLDREFVGGSANRAGGGTDPIDEWSVVVKQAPRRWVQALLLSPDGQRFAYCTLDTQGTYRQEYIREAVEAEPDYRVTTGGIDGAAGKLPADVARLTFRTPDGVVSEARTKDGFFLWFNGRSYTDKPIWATFYNAAGKELARFNANPAPKVPSARAS